MEKVSIKQAFGNEVSFTKFISDDCETKKRLLESLSYSTYGEYTIETESKTIDSKRVDLVLKDDEGEILNVIESQDSSGWLDTIHSTKISYYCWEKKCNYGTLITEDASEHIKNYVKWLNENTPLNITILKSSIYKIKDDTFFVDFFPIMRYVNDTEKKIQSKQELLITPTFDNFYSRINENLLSKWLIFQNECEEKLQMQFDLKKSYIAGRVKNMNTNIVVYCNFNSNGITLDIGRGNVNEEKSNLHNLFSFDKDYPFVKNVKWTWKNGQTGNKYSIKFNEQTDTNLILDLFKQKIDDLK